MRKNFFIYLTSFVSGIAVMGVELSATRLLAPYFGTSSIVYTIVIGLIMISMSIGNVIGGRSADKHNNLGRLFTMLWIAAIWTAIIPLVGKYVIALSAVIMMWILPGSLLAAGSALSCLLVFSAPLLILGMVSPYLVKLGIKDMEKSGRTAGEIYAANTAGSIASNATNRIPSPCLISLFINIFPRTSSSVNQVFELQIIFLLQPKAKPHHRVIDPHLLKI